MTTEAINLQLSRGYTTGGAADAEIIAVDSVTGELIKSWRCETTGACKYDARHNLFATDAAADVTDQPAADVTGLAAAADATAHPKTSSSIWRELHAPSGQR